MGFRFYRRIKIVPGLYINVGKKGLSTSIGTKGARVTMGKNGTRYTVGIPGTGLSYSESSPKKTGQRKTNHTSPAMPTQQASKWGLAVLGLVLVGIIALSVTVFRSCRQSYYDKIDQRNYAQSEAGSKARIESTISQRIGEHFYTKVFYESQWYDSEERSWFMEGTYMNEKKRVKGTFKAQVRRPLRPDPRLKADYELVLLDMKDIPYE